jgi:hypothetical protein
MGVIFKFAYKYIYRERNTGTAGVEIMMSRVALSAESMT